MKILTIADIVVPALCGEFDANRFKGIDLILSCGDLPSYYLEYVVSLLDAPLFFVHGNHDNITPPIAAGAPNQGGEPVALKVPGQ